MNVAACMLAALFLTVANTTDSAPSLAALRDREVVVEAAGPPAGRTPVVVELFTSEGCSTCPVADQFLKKLEADQPVKGAEVIALEEHVDYWNRGGWTDPYSAAEWTRRQLSYVSRFKEQGAYTPQMVVGGERSFVGSEEAVAYAAIKESAHHPELTAFVALEGRTKDTWRLHVRVDRLATTRESSGREVFLALAEVGLASSVTAGENAGRRLPHASVLRSLQRIGTTDVKPGAPLFEASPEVRLQSRWNKDLLRVVVFVQDSKTLRILGAATTRAEG